MNPFSRFLLIALVLGAVLVGVAVYLSRGTAEAAAIQAYPAAAQFDFQGDYVAPFGIGRFLLYQWQTPTASFPRYGYLPIKRNWWGQWRVGTGGKCSNSSTEQAGDIVDFHAHYLGSPYDATASAVYSVVCGRINSTAVHTVAVRWADGALTGALVKQGWFIILKPERQAACQLQLLDNTETVIQTIDLAQFDFISTDATTPLPPCAGN